jgi:hypothetical protein
MPVLKDFARIACKVFKTGISPVFYFAYRFLQFWNILGSASVEQWKSFLNYSCKYEFNVYLCAQVENNNYKPLKKNQNGKNNNHWYAHRS